MRCILVILVSISAVWSLSLKREKLSSVSPPDGNWTTQWYEQQLDHFSYGVQQLTFMQKYLVNIDHWNRTGGPIFFYAGNEGSIELFALNTGFMFEIAPEFGAMVLFAEHRYYGSSIPFGKNGYVHKQYYQYQSSMQALADYVELLAHVRQTYEGAEKSPVIVFGGSYGGMLAAWMRIKYPHVVQGAIAASAPVAQFTGLTPCEKFGQVVTHTFALQGQECVQTIRKSWDAINKMAATAEGRAWLSDAWRLCKPLNSTDDAKNLKSYLSDVWTNLAMADYPYMANFLAPLPAYPVMAVCQPMKFLKDEPKEILLEIFEGLSVYFNYSTTATCLSYESSMPSSLDDNGWFLQSCTEMVMPMCYDGKNDFFEPQAWNLTEFSETCVKKWDVRPEPYKMEQMYGGRNLKYASNIVFSNGLLDPWSSGGVLEDVNESVVSVIIPEGAHHLDLRSSERADPKSVIQARDVHKANILKWISEYSNSV
ncbi:lysosomal Pro-X carboxypeptidase isoform X2 [Hyalella azteca]|uniref:Lysosomal Pro-X carboxypeptidase n=1 Tax=Hyalella azteca TaxID=294128 RepID=A0A8B7PQI3_HYAAZ|nr:lysosomal Pro-X carboxypeptidase isoform X2 [Hyalella azteca]